VPLRLGRIEPVRVVASYNLDDATGIVAAKRAGVDPLVVVKRAPASNRKHE
jgi:hypothetical protein